MKPTVRDAFALLLVQVAAIQRESLPDDWERLPDDRESLLANPSVAEQLG